MQDTRSRYSALALRLAATLPLLILNLGSTSCVFARTAPSAPGSAAPTTPRPTPPAPATEDDGAPTPQEAEGVEAAPVEAGSLVNLASRLEKLEGTLRFAWMPSARASIDLELENPGPSEQVETNSGRSVDSALDLTLELDGDGRHVAARLQQFDAERSPSTSRPGSRLTRFALSATDPGRPFDPASNEWDLRQEFTFSYLNVETLGDEFNHYGVGLGALLDRPIASNVELFARLGGDVYFGRGLGAGYEVSLGARFLPRQSPFALTLEYARQGFVFDQTDGESKEDGHPYPHGDLGFEGLRVGVELSF